MIPLSWRLSRRMVRMIPYAERTFLIVLAGAAPPGRNDSKPGSGGGEGACGEY
jgi:hypothetical protein